MDNNNQCCRNEKSILYKMLIFPNLPQNVDKIPNSRGPGTHIKKCRNDPV